MSAHHTHNVIELRRLGKVAGHLSNPSDFVSIDPISELVGECCRIQTFGRGLVLEQQAHFSQRHPHVFDESKEIV